MYSARLTSAFEWASRLHATHKRKGVDAPYLSHLLGVASLALEYHGDEDRIIASLLHDAVEDCGGVSILDAIRAEFGDIVAETVMQCSDSMTEDVDAKLPWQDRKRAYIAAVATKSERAAFVTACDKLHNASAILNDHLLGADADGKTVWDRFGGKSLEQTVAYYTAMVSALDGRVPADLWTRLQRTVAALEVLADPVEHRRWVASLTGANAALAELRWMPREDSNLD